MVGTMQSGLTAVLFTDLVGSTELRSRLGDDSADELRRTHDQALGAVVESQGGTVVKGLGDGLMATFAGASEAVSAAVAMQQAITRLNRRVEGAPLALRIGVSAGDVTWEGDDCFGEPVIEASRLCGVADGGKILCSEVVRILARSGAGYEFVALGDVTLKGLPEPIAACEVLWHAPPPEFPLPAALRTRSVFPFVGRIEERELLLAAWKRSAAGDPVAVLVAGEPGVGKTRLVGELASTARSEGGLVVAGRCDEEGGPPYQPLFEALRHFVDHCPPVELADRLGQYAGDLERLFPDLKSRVPELPAPLQADEDSERYRLFDAVAAWLAAASVDQPVLLAVDDLHWADKPTLLALRHLLRSGAPGRLLVVATYRDTDLDRAHPLASMLAELRREPRVRRLDLQGLTSDEVGAFLEVAAGHELEEGGQILARGLHAETEGNPFFLEEVLAHLIETGALYQGEDGRWRSDLTTVEEFGIPEGVREVVGRRLSRLSDACNRLLGQGAVLGAEFEVAALRAMTGTDVVEALEEAARSSLISETGGERPAYTFTHALVRQTLLDELSVARRQQYHLRAAQALETTGARPAAVVAQYRQAGAASDPEKVVAASLLAAEEARQRLAWEDASDHWEAALELLEVQGGEPKAQARLIEQLGDAMYATGRDWERGIEQLERAVEIYEGLGDVYEAAKVRSRIARNLGTFPGRIDARRASEHIETARPALEERGDSPALAYLEIAFSTTCTFSLRAQEGLDAARRGLEIGERLGHDVVSANARLLAGWHAANLGRVSEGLDLLQAGYEVSVRHGQPILAFLAAWLSSGVAMNLMDPATGLDWVERELASGRLDGAPGLRTLVQTQIGTFLVHRGRLAEGDEFWSLAPPQGPGAILRLQAQGRWDETIEFCREQVEGSEAVGDRWGAGFYRWNLGQTLYLAGDLAPAEQHLTTALQVAERGTNRVGSVYDLPTLAQVHHAQGRPDAVGAVVARCEEAASHLDELRGLAAPVMMARGLAARSGEDADPHFAAAAEVARSYDIPWVAAMVHEEWGAKVGRTDPIDVALGIYERIGAALAWVERARRIRHNLEGSDG